MVISRLDYCNPTLAGLPQATIAPLQRVQKSAARLILELSTHDHICLAMSVTVALATSTRERPVQTVLHYVLRLPRDVPSVSVKHC